MTEMFVITYKINVFLWMCFLIGRKALDDFEIPLIVVIPICMFILIEFIIETFEFLTLLLNCF